MSLSSSPPSAKARTPSLRAQTPRSTFWLVLIAIMLLSANMRSPIVALGSIAPVIQDSLQISEVQIGWLGAIPMLMFALGALISPSIGKRFGLENTLITMIALLTSGIVLRSVWDTWTGFLLGTMMLSLAIGFANTLAAPIIKQRTPNHIPLITGLFSLTMTVVAGMVAGVIYPLTTAFGWQLALGGWAILGIFAIVFWLLLRVKLGSSHRLPNTLDASVDEDTTIWRSALAWQLAVFMGLQSLMFYTVASFLPSIWADKGLDQVAAGQMASVFQLMGPAAIISMTWLIRRGVAVQKVAVAAASFNVIGAIGIAYLPNSLAWLWSGSMGLGCAGIFTMSIMLFSLRTYTPHQASKLSGMVQTIAYLIAFLGPVMTGWLHERAGNWDIPLLLIIILMVINVGVAWLASRPIMIDGQPAQ